MLFSIIVSSHNRQWETKRLLDRVLKYNGDYEVVVVDYDNPTPFIVNDPRVRVISCTRFPYKVEQGLNLSHMRNIGAKCAKGDWFMFLDCDLEPAPNALPELESVLRSGDKMCVYSGLRIKKNYAGSPIAEDPPNAHMPNIPLFGFCHIIHRKMFNEINGYNEGFFGWGEEDTEFIDRCFKRGMSTRVILRARLNHPLHPDNAWHGEKHANPMTEPGGFIVDQVTEFELDRDKYIKTICELESQNAILTKEKKNQEHLHALQMVSLTSQVSNLEKALSEANELLAAKNTEVQPEPADMKVGWFRRFLNRFQ